MRSAAHHQQAITTAIRLLAAEQRPACLLDSQGAFIYVNEAWEHFPHGFFAAGAGSALIGTRLVDHIRGEELRGHIAQIIGRTLMAGGRARAVTQIGEANTASTAALVSTRYAPVLLAGEPLGLSIVHTVVRERPIEEVYDVVHRPLEEYRDGSGAITQCGCCQRIRDVTDPARWELVPAILAVDLATHQTLCELCAELHFGLERIP